LAGEGESWFFWIDLPSSLDNNRNQDRVNGFATKLETRRVPSQAKVDIEAAWPVTLALERLGGSLEIPRPVARFVASRTSWAAHNRQSWKLNEFSPRVRPGTQTSAPRQ
jgi:hypothetical protein